MTESRASLVDTDMLVWPIEAGIEFALCSICDVSPGSDARTPSTVGSFAPGRVSTARSLRVRPCRPMQDGDEYTRIGHAFSRRGPMYGRTIVSKRF